MDETIANVVSEIRTECTRRAEQASTMRFGKTRACEFAYVCGLQEAADLLERRTSGLAQHPAEQFAAFWQADGAAPSVTLVSNELNRSDVAQVNPDFDIQWRNDEIRALRARVAELESGK